MSATPPQSLTPTTVALTWQPLRVLCIYRLVLAALLLGGFLIGRDSGLFAPDRPQLFLGLTSAYLVFSFTMLLFAWRRQRGFLAQVVLQGVVDVFVITGLIHASGGLQAGLGVVMLAAVAGNSLLAGVRMGAFFAALATLLLLADQALLAEPAGGGRYTEAGLLGIITFATALTGAFLARRARESEALARSRGLDIADLEALNAHIVQRLETGVLAIDNDGNIRLANAASRALVGALERGQRPPLAERAPRLDAAYRRWLETWEEGQTTIAHPSSGVEFVPRFQPIGPGGQNGTLVFLENLTEMRARVQQAKLASLGRLTASIAHEVRNPLAAILQAAQLLEETDYLDKGEQRLVGIITKQGRRMNKTVDNVLQLSRRAPASRDVLDIDRWLARLADEWHEQQRTALGTARITTELEPVEGLFDPDHLRQVVDNLIRNALDHAGSESPEIRLRCDRVDEYSGRIEVADNGAGIAPALREQLFEPFVTGSAGGTGLGLYLSRELCEANQARLQADDEPGGGACFRILFTRTRGEATTP